MNSVGKSITAPTLILLVFNIFLFDCGNSSRSRSALPSNQVALPTVDRPAGYFVDPIDVTITPGTAGTIGDTVELTTDGSDPVCGSGTAYASTTITISATTTVKAVACMDGYDDSDVFEATYTVMGADTRVSPGSGTPIQDAIDAASTGDVIYIEPGTYTENNGEVVIDKPITLIGSGSGADSTTNTIITDAPSNQNVIAISAGGTASTLVAVRNLRVTGSLGPGGNEGAGLEIRTADGNIEIDNVAAVGNSGNGISFDVVAAETSDIVIRNCDLSFNDFHGLRVPSSLDHINGLTIDNTTFEGNSGAGIMLYYLGYEVGGSTNVFITNSTFEGNASGAYQLGDLVFSSFNGNATLSTISINSDASESGIRLTGRSSGSTAFGVAGNMTLSNVNISGVQQSYGTYPSGAFVVTRYLGISNVSMSNVELGSTAPNGLFIGTITAGASTVSGAGLGPDLGDLLFTGTYSQADIKLGSHGNSGSYDVTDVSIDATGVTFQGAMDDADIEDRVYHQVDVGALGLVSWTTP